jgi:hypothetical protein
MKTLFRPRSARAAKNREASERFAKREYPNEKFISDSAEFQTKNRFTKGLIIPENVKVAESRAPINSRQREVLRKELRQAEILSKLGNSVVLIPEKSGYRIRPKDALVNGELFEFRTVQGNAETFQWEFRTAKRKGADTNVYINILSNIGKEEAKRRVWLVLRRHPEYTGKIITSFDDGRKTYFWDTSSFRQKKPLP